MEIKRLTAGPFLTNTYLLIFDSEALIIDPTIGLEKYIDEINKYKIKGILLTHGHIDHIASINIFDCPVYIYEDEANKLYDNDLNLANMFNFDFCCNNQDIRLLKNNEILDFDFIKIKVIHTPGHTNGSVSFLVNDVIFSGDTLFQMSVGRTDFPTGNSLELRKSIALLINSFDNTTIIYPGHGEATTIELEKNNPFYR